MSETQFYAFLVVGIVCVALLAATLTGLVEAERVFDMLPLFEDVIGD